jgi:hypothetical protein
MHSASEIATGKSLVPTGGPSGFVLVNAHVSWIIPMGPVDGKSTRTLAVCPGLCGPDIRHSCRPAFTAGRLRDWAFEAPLENWPARAE